MKYDEMDTIVERILNGENVRVLSTGEQIAAAFLFNKPHWLPASYSHPLDAIIRLGADWTEKMLAYHADPRRNRTGEYEG